jgi:signal transduction histidine kinase
MTLAGHRWPAARLISPPADELVLVHGLLRALAAFRWFAWVWMSIVATIDLHNGVVAHPTALVGFGATALALTAAITVVVRVAPADALRWPLLLVELVLGAAMVGLDPWVYGPGVDHAQSLGSVWPLAAVLAVGVRAGGRAGVMAGLVIGVSRGLGEAVVVGGDWDGDRVLGVFGSMVLYALGGGAAGLTAVRLREARREISLARAREEVARTLHDGVLQTLAMVQRRRRQRVSRRRPGSTGPRFR